MRETMTTISRTGRRLALASLLAGASLWPPSAAPAQTTSPASVISPSVLHEVHAKDGPFLPPAPDSSIVPVQTTNPSAVAGPVPTPNPDVQAQTGAEGQGAGKATGWAAIPSYLRPDPRVGWFLLPPRGTGYYTALDCLKGTEKDNPPPYPYRNMFYENDFRYLDAPDGKEVDCLDSLKRMHLGGLFNSCADNWVLSIGGEERIQLKNEIDSRLTARDNNYDLLRTRVYADLWYQDKLRFYVEYLDAQSYNEDLAPLAIDVDHSDLLDLFVDVKLADVNGNPVYARVGRQELLYGSQRLISTLDWANTRRTFEGAKVFYHSDKFDLDVFWTRPVVVSPSHFDTADFSRQFAGMFSTYRPAKGQAIDAYYLYLDSDTRVPFGFTPGGRAGYDVNTIGGRYYGDRKIRAGGCTDRGSFLWDFEGAVQLGDWSNRNYFAGMSSTGIGYQATQRPMQPAFWIYYDFASGTANPTGTGTFSTFNQLFPYGHYYFGYLDEVGRENIRDLNFQATAFPTKWITALAQFHIFTLDEPRSPLFGTAPGFPIMRSDPTGRAGIDVGQELDLLLNMNLGRHSSLLLGYSKLFSAGFINQTGPAVSPELYYLQYTFRW
jgi:Alginate export